MSRLATLEENLPVDEKRKYFLDHYFLDHLKKLVEARRCIFLTFDSKGGKTSFTNVFSEHLLNSTYIPVKLQLDLSSPDQSFSLLTQIFTAIFNELIKRDSLGEQNPFYMTWRKQVNSAEININQAEELLQTGSRIAFHLRFPDSPMIIDPVTLNNDLYKLNNYIKENNLGANFVLILDNPMNLLELNDGAKKLFGKLFSNENSPLLVATLPATLIDKGSVDSLSLFSFFQKWAPSTSVFLEFPIMKEDNIFDLIIYTENLYEESVARNLARQVHRITDGNPYLTKLLLKIIGSKMNSLDNPEISTVDCTRLVNQSRSLFSQNAADKMKILNNLRKEKSNLLKSAIDTIIGASALNNYNGQIRIETLKNPRELLLTKYIPQEVHDIESQLNNYVTDLRSLWEMGLVDIVDEDFQIVSFANNPKRAVISEKTRLYVPGDKFLVTWTKVLAKEENADLYLPSRQGYFDRCATKFSDNLLNFILDTSGKNVAKMQSPHPRFLPGRRPRHDTFFNRPNNLNVSIRESISNLNYEIFSDFFMFNRSLQFTSFEQTSYEFNYFCLTITFKELRAPEEQEVLFLIRLDKNDEFEQVEMKLLEWLSSNQKILEDIYNVSVHNYSFIRVDSTFVNDVIFLTTRNQRLRVYWDLFRKGDYENLGLLLQNHLSREIIFAKKLKSDSGLMEDFYNHWALQMSFMSATCGLFNLSMEGLNLYSTSQYEESLMRADDKTIVLASLGEVDEAVNNSYEVLDKLSKNQIEHNVGYWKLIFIPFESSRNELGSNWVYSEKWPLLSYKIQHAILLLIKSESGELTERDRSFLSDIALILDEREVESIALSDLPIHRLLAYYLDATGRNGEAQEVLNALIKNESTYPALQVKCAKMDLVQIREV